MSFDATPLGTYATPPVPRSIGDVAFDSGKALWLWLNISGALTALLVFGLPSWGQLALVAAATLGTLCLGHSVGLHRGEIHRTFRMRWGTRRVLLMLSMLTGLGGLRTWIHLHFVRDHWQNHADCPPYFAYRHSLRRDFWWNLHCGFRPRDGRRPDYVSARWDDDGFVAFVHRTWWVWNLVLFAVLFATVDLHTALLLGPARVAGGILGHWFIGYWTHRWGERRFTIPGAVEHGSNSLVIGWVSFGEGFHNNHHAMPGSARMGWRWWEFDVGYAFVLLLEAAGLIEDVRSWLRDEPERTGAVPRRAAGGAR